MQSGIAPPQGFALSNLRSNKKVSIPAFASVSAAEEPAGPEPTTATRIPKGILPIASNLARAHDRALTGVHGITEVLLSC